MCSLKSQRSSADRISSLPEFIKHRILSYLPPKDSIKTSVLSNGWNSTWNNFPILDFRQHPLDRETLLSLIDKSLRRFARSNLAIQKLFIDLFWIKEDSIPLVDAWLPSALSSGVSELFFKVTKYEYPCEYHVPEEAFSGAASKHIFSKFFKLQNLSIYNAFMSEKIFQDITESCPNISTIVLESIHGVDSLEISRLQKLETLFLSDCHKLQILKLSLLGLKVLSVRNCAIKSVHIDAPNLSEFTLQSAMGDFSPSSWNVLAHCNMIDSDLIVCETLMDSSWFVDLRRFLKTLTPGRMNLQISFDAWPPNIMAVSFDPNMIGEGECSTLIRVDHLDIPESPLSLESSSILLEGLLWSCRPKVLSCTGILAKILCKKLLQIREGRLCCSGINFKCWRHYLKAAKINFIENLLPDEKNGEIEYEQFLLALEYQISSFHWGDDRHCKVQFSLEWVCSTTTKLTVNNPE